MVCVYCHDGVCRKLRCWTERFWWSRLGSCNECAEHSTRSEEWCSLYWRPERVNAVTPQTEGYYSLSWCPSLHRAGALSRLTWIAVLSTPRHIRVIFRSLLISYFSNNPLVFLSYYFFALYHGESVINNIDDLPCEIPVLSPIQLFFKVLHSTKYANPDFFSLPAVMGWGGVELICSSLTPEPSVRGTLCSFMTILHSIKLLLLRWRNNRMTWLAIYAIYYNIHGKIIISIEHTKYASVQCR